MCLIILCDFVIAPTALRPAMVHPTNRAAASKPFKVLRLQSTLWPANTNTSVQTPNNTWSSTSLMRPASTLKAPICQLPQLPKSAHPTHSEIDFWLKIVAMEWAISFRCYVIWFLKIKLNEWTWKIIENKLYLFIWLVYSLNSTQLMYIPFDFENCEQQMIISNRWWPSKIVTIERPYGWQLFRIPLIGDNSCGMCTANWTIASYFDAETFDTQHTMAFLSKNRQLAFRNRNPHRFYWSSPQHRSKNQGSHILMQISIHHNWSNTHFDTHNDKIQTTNWWLNKFGLFLCSIKYMHFICRFQRFVSRRRWIHARNHVRNMKCYNVAISW